MSRGDMHLLTYAADIVGQTAGQTTAISRA